MLMQLPSETGVFSAIQNDEGMGEISKSLSIFAGNAAIIPNVTPKPPLGGD